MKRYRVTGVLLTNTTREQVDKFVEAPHDDFAISVVHCEAIRDGKLFLSAVATPEMSHRERRAADRIRVSLNAGLPKGKRLTGGSR